MIEAVLFDLDQTLLDRKSSLAAFLRGQWERFSSGLGNASFEEWRGKFLTLDKQGMVPKSEVYPQILTEFGGDPALSGALLADYSLRSCEYARAFAATEPTLASLRVRGLKLGIVTNGETDFQSRNIAALGLDRRVDAVLISQCEGLRKPDRRLFQRAADRLGAKPEKCLFVGDNPVADILGAHDAGMRTAWFSGAGWPSGTSPNPGPSIQALSQVIDLAR
jgi:putative hydrolase of the HAD superfamily